MYDTLKKEKELKDTSFVVIDFETTGTASGNSRVIEIGLVLVENLKIKNTFHTLINPGSFIPPFITNLTGITNEDVEYSPCFEDIIHKITEFIGDSVIAAHNLPFDYAFLKKEYEFAREDLPANDSICTLKIARKLYPGLKSKSLGALVKHFRLRHKDVHRALGDATVTAKLLIKIIGELKEEFNISTLEELSSFQYPSALKRGYKLIKKKLAHDVELLPASPGVYLFKDRFNEIIYIGKAKALKSRVNNYFTSASGSKSKKIIRKASSLEHIKTNSELSALLAEAEMIKINNPVFNSQLKKYSQAYFVKVNLNHNFPDLSVTSVFDFDGNDYFGPFLNSDIAKTLVEITDRTFMLRECSEKEFNKKKKCYLKDIKRCLAPCEEMEQTEYMDELENVYKFLSGGNQDAVNRLLTKMKFLSEEKKYEEAAQIRDTVNLILNQLNRASILAEPVNKANVLIEVRNGSEKEKLLLVDGKLFIKDFPLDENSLFNSALEDYFNGSKQLIPELNKKHLERLKISLSWLVKNRSQVNILYLTDYVSERELTAAMRK